MRTDGQLQQYVLDELRWELAVDASRIGVEVKNGVVTLDGVVSSLSEKAAAERAAQRVAGVKSIAMALEVELPGHHLRNDADIAAAARNALDWNASVPRDAIKVVVENSVVKLRGEVGWAYARTAADTCVRQLTGVRDVINLVAIKPVTPTVHDIKGKIEAALQRQAHRHTKAITVGVDERTVMLAGEVASLAERDAIELAAWNAPGVASVVDRIIIAP